MADEEDLLIDGKPISTLRVVDLKKECDKRGISKAGSKSQLLERLKTELMFDNLHNEQGDTAKAGKKKVKEDDCQNEFIKQYLARQKQLIENAENSMTSSSQDSDADDSPKKRRQSVEQSPHIRSPPLEISPEKVGPIETQPALKIEEQKGPSVAEKGPPSAEKRQPTIEKAAPVAEKQAAVTEKEVKKSVSESKISEPEESANMGRGRRRLSRIESDTKSEQIENNEQTKPNERRSRRSRSSRSAGSEHDESGEATQNKAAGEPLAEITQEKVEVEKAPVEKQVEELPVVEKQAVTEMVEKIEVAKKTTPIKEISAKQTEKEDKEARKEEIPEKKEILKEKPAERESEKTERVADEKTQVKANEGEQKERVKDNIEESKMEVDKPEIVEKSDRKQEKNGENIDVIRQPEVEKQPVPRVDKEKPVEKLRRRSRLSSSSSSSSSDSSRSPSREGEKKARSSSSSSSSSRSRSRSPDNKKKSSISAPLRRKTKAVSRSSSSSRSRSPSPKRVRKLEESKPEVAEKKEEVAKPAEVAKVTRSPEVRQRSRSSSSRSRSPSPVVEKMETEKVLESPAKEKERPVMSVSTAVVKEPVQETPEPVKDDHPTLQTEVKVSKKISLNRKTIEDAGTAAVSTVEKMEDKTSGGEEKLVKKRKWGSRSGTNLQKPKPRSSMPISTDSLKSLIPDIKPSLKLAPEPIMEDEMDYEDDTITTTEPAPPTVTMEIQSDTRAVKIQRTVTQDVGEKSEGEESDADSDSAGEEKKDEGDDDAKQSSGEDDSGEKEKEREIQREIKREIKQEEGEGEEEDDDAQKEKEEEEETKKTIIVTKKVKKDRKDRNREIKVFRRLESGGSALIKPDEPERIGKSPSPARNPVGKIIHVRNLVRPFTLPQLKELLSRHGTPLDEGFWIDRIKSHCFATYGTDEEANNTRHFLHNTKWPLSNPKTLTVDFAAQDQLDYYRGNMKPIPPPEKKEKPVVVKAERQKDGERDKKIRDEREKELERRRKEREQRIKERDEREKPRTVREWDKDKKTREDWDRTLQKSRSRSPREEKGRRSMSPRERKQGRSMERGREREDRREKKKVSVEKKDNEPPAKLLDDLFRKTKTTPCIYWLPLTEDQIAARQKAGYVRPVLRQRPQGNLVSPERVGPPDDDKPVRKPQSTSPAAKQPREVSGEHPRGRRPSPERRRSPPERRRRQSSPTDNSRSRSGRRR